MIGKSYELTVLSGTQRLSPEKTIASTEANNISYESLNTQLFRARRNYFHNSKVLLKSDLPMSSIEEQKPKEAKWKLRYQSCVFDIVL